jgi:hypothetical protein
LGVEENFVTFSGGLDMHLAFGFCDLPSSGGEHLRDMLIIMVRIMME